MKDKMLNQEQLNKIYQKWNVNNSLADFLYDCNDQLHHGEIGFYYDDLEQLSNEQLTYLVDWWNGKQSNEQQTIQVIAGDDTSYLLKDAYGKYTFGNLIAMYRSQADLSINWDSVRTLPVKHTKED